MAKNITATVKRYKAYVMTLNTETGNVETLPVYAKTNDGEKIMKTARNQFKGTHNVPAKVVEIETIEKLYSVSTDIFIENAEKITKPGDIKGDAITRTVKAYKAEILCLDIDMEAPFTVTRTVSSNDPEKALKEARKTIPASLVPCKVTGFEIIGNMYGMTLEKFTHIAEEVTD